MKYPIGIQDFRKLREEGYLYVDKTEHIHDILSGSRYLFLSRPRRFGKSLLLSTLNELYSGSQELFEGLWIEDKWDWAQINPVIWLRFSQIDYQKKGLYDALFEEIQRIARSLGIVLSGATLKDCFNELIGAAHRKYKHKTVLLIDEYDKPIIDFLDAVPQALENRNTLKHLYSVLKDNDSNLQTVFMTGVSAFSKLSIFSDLNNLDNLTFSPSAYTLLGITEGELNRFFPQQMAVADVGKMKRWYNGYSWGGSDRVYNPFSILLFFKEGQQYQNYWFETGTPTFLVKEMKQKQYYDIEGTQASSADLSNFDIERLNPLTVLFQTGYLTIQKYVEEDLLYTLDYPNLEVKHSLQQILSDWEHINLP
jgi:hypothetical protein